MPFPTDPVEFLFWLASAGAAGTLISLLLERSAAFQDLSPKAKHYLVLAGFVFVPVLATLTLGLLGLLSLPNPEVVSPQEVVTFWLRLALQGLTAWGASQYAHGADPETKKQKALNF